MKIRLYNYILLILYATQIIVFMIFARGGFKAISAGIICIEMGGLVLGLRVKRDSKLFIPFLIFNIVCLLINLAMTLVYMPTDKQIPVVIFIITLLVTLTLLIKIVLDCCIKKEVS